MMFKKILIVDDEEDVRKSLFKALKRAKYEIFMAENGKEALGILGNTDIDLMIMEIILPDENGVEVLTKIKKVSPDALSIILTAYGSKEVVVESLRGGADYYFDKPFKEKELIKTVNNLLRMKDSKGDGDGNLIRPEDIGNGRGIISKVVDLVEKSYGSRTLQSISKELCLSPSYLSRIFKEKTNIGFREFGRNLRIIISKKLLEHTFYNISEIAYKLGYSHPEDFTKQFKQITGLAPTDYRKKKKKGWGGKGLPGRCRGDNGSWERGRRPGEKV